MLKVTAQGVSRVFCGGYKITASWPAPVGAPEIPQRRSRVDVRERCSSKMPHLPVTHDPWITDMLITAYQVSACLRKGLSPTSTHMSEICRQKPS